MKKLMTLAAVALVAAAAQASKVNWSFTTSATGTYFAGAADLSSYTAYLITASDWDTSDVAGSLAKKQQSVASSSWTRNTYSTSDSKAQFSYTGGLATGLTLATGDTSFYVVLADGEKYWASSELTATVLADDSIATDYKTAKVALSGASAITSAALTSYGAPAPEPTSGVLMMLGLAGLALRRKRA